MAPAGVPVQGTDAGKTRWSLYTGAVVLTQIYGVNKSEPMALCIDLATLSAPATIPCLAGHIAVPTAVLGTWTGIAVDAAGLGADFSPLPIPAEAADLFNSARAIGALLAAKVPLQASVGVEPGPAGEYVRLTKPTMVNGKMVDPAQFSDPVFMLKGGLISEASIVLFGADNQTGPRLSASTLSQGSTMERLKALLAAHPDHVALVAALVADGKDDTAIASAIHGAQLAALTTERDAARTELATLKAQVATLTTERDTARTDLAAALAKGKPTGTQMPQPGTGDVEGPKTLAAALARHASDHKARGLDAAARIDAVRALYPELPR
jgi:hypothetical protein